MDVFPFFRRGGTVGQDRQDIALPGEAQDAARCAAAPRHAPQLAARFAGWISLRGAEHLSQESATRGISSSSAFSDPSGVLTTETYCDLPRPRQKCPSLALNSDSFFTLCRILR